MAKTATAILYQFEKRLNKQGRNFRDRLGNYVIEIARKLDGWFSNTSWSVFFGYLFFGVLIAAVLFLWGYADGCNEVIIKMKGAR